MITHKALIPTLVPSQSFIRSLLLALTGSLVVALTAQLEIPLQPVPITGQTFGVLLVGALLGSRLGFFSLVLYLLEGLALPVFSGGATWTSPGTAFTAGYLLAFPVAAFVVGFLAERFAADRHVLKTFLAMVVANIVIYIPGLVWLGMALSRISSYEGFAKLLEAGMTPFLMGDLLKALLAAVILPLAWRFVKRS
jgi:biotin transport system substrate-specific component